MEQTHTGFRRLEYFGWGLLVNLFFALPCAWLESEQGPSGLIPFMFVYGLYGLLTGIMIERRAKNIGFQFKESFPKIDGADDLIPIKNGFGRINRLATVEPTLGPVTIISITLFLLLGLAVWADVTKQHSDSLFLISVATLLLVVLILAIPLTLYLLFAPEGYRKPSTLRGERKRLEKELKKIKEINEIEKLKEEIERLKSGA